MQGIPEAGLTQLIEETRAKESLRRAVVPLIRSQTGPPRDDLKSKPTPSLWQYLMSLFSTW